MAEGDTPPVTPPSTPPAGEPPATPPATPPSGTPPPTPPATPPAGVSQEEFDKVKKEYEDYRNKVDPVLETIYVDGELLKTVTAKHKQRLGGGAPATPPNTPPATPPVADPDVRNSQINMISNDFESKVGIDKLPDEKKAEIRGMVGTMVKEMLDPKGNKTITQVFEEVSLTKLPWYFEKAYDLVTKDSQIASKIEEEKTKWENEQRGVIGGAPSTSIPIDNITLSAEERRVAANMGLTDAQYLEQKKAIIQRRES